MRCTVGINILDSETINKIAAGEVVERPSSVVKELVENAIDAGATAVTIEIKDGGISFIRITDNGCGISREDIPKAFLRHATSKIKSVEDLMSIASLGFRGEALSSIAAVSETELITKTADDVSGYRYVCEAGSEKEFEEVGAPQGTTIIVRNLFFNTPARRKFLKTASTEGTYVGSLVEHLALSHPDISFRFISNGANKLHTAGNMNLRDIIYGVYGRDIAANLIEVSGKTQDIRISGYIGRPMIVRGNRSYENYYINGRYIKSSVITKAVEDAYKGFIMPHNYPFTAIHFNIEPDIMDVNVHPQKMELRFSKNEVVYDFIYSTLTEALRRMDLAVSVSLEDEKESFALRNGGQGSDTQRDGRQRNSVRGLGAQSNGLQDSGVQSKSVQGDSSRSAGTQNVSMQDSDRQNEAVQDVNVQNANSQGVNVQNANSQGVNAKNVGIQDSGLDNKNIYNSGADTVSTHGAGTQSGQRQIINEQVCQSHSVRLPEPFEVTRSQQMIKEDEASYTARASQPEAKQVNLFTDSFLNEDNKNRYRVIGQLFDTYWLVEFEDKFYIMDQHAAHEKVLYERLMAKISQAKMDSQMIMPPIVVELNIKELEVLEENMDCFYKLGFELENFGDKAYKITAVPASLPNIDYMQMFIDLLDNMVDESGFGYELLAQRVATMSCKAAIKGNNKISFEEARELIYELSQAENPFNCPHGRPTLIVMSKYEIEKKFKRIV